MSQRYEGRDLPNVPLSEERHLMHESDELILFLFSPEEDQEPSDSTREMLTPRNYLDLLASTIDAYIEGDPLISTAVQRFVIHADVEFIEPKTPEEQLTLLADRAETEISSFIEFNQATSSLSFLGETELNQLCEFYNPNNLLAFAKELNHRSSGSLSSEQLDMIYRYRAMLKLLDAKKEMVRAASLGASTGQRVTRDGARTWAGDIHPYGHQSGHIDPVEYRDFSDDDDPGHASVIIDGRRVKMSSSEKIT